MNLASVFSVARKNSSRRLVVASFAAATTVIACSSSSSAPTSSSNDHDAGTSASTVTPTWTFGGGTTTSSFTSGVSPSVVTIPAGGNVTASIAFTFGDPTGSGSLVFSSANNQATGGATNDVSPPTLPTDDAAPTSSDPENGAINNPVLYLSIFNAGPSTISFDEAPSVTLTATGDLAAILSGDVSCQLDLYVDGSWVGAGEVSNQGQALSSPLTIPAATLPNEAALQIAPGQFLAAIGCD